MTIEEKLAMIEKLFQSMLSKQINEVKFCKELSVILSSIHRYQYDVCISNYNQKEKFYGMRIFPAIATNYDNTDPQSYDVILNPILNTKADEKVKISFASCYNTWKNQELWVLEIDAAVFDAHQINLNPKELVAMMLHEIGHVIYSEKTIERIYLAMMDMKMVQNMTTKYTMSLTSFLFYPVIVAACKLRKWFVGKNEINIEIFADKNVVKYGYGENLTSAFGKVIKYFGRSTDSSTPETEAVFSANLVNQLTARHSRVGNELYIKAAKSSSKYIQTIYRIMLVKLGFVSKARYTGIVAPELPAIESLFASNFIVENDLVFTMDSGIALESICRAGKYAATQAVEGVLHKKKKVKTKDDELNEIDYDIDKITIDADKITSHHDRIYVLDLIYEVNERLNLWKAAIDEFTVNRKYVTRVEQMSKRLEQLRELVLSKKNFDKRYELFVKYPSGYEG